MTKDVQRWADPAMFEAEPMPTQEPRVYLLEATSDPLGSIAAMSAMYTGKVTRSKEDVTDAERDHHLKEMSLTYLTTPLESVRLHFMIEGVTRAFTHQLVRTRTSAYAQESLRFAVVEAMPVALPPSLQGTTTEAEVIRNWAGLGIRVAGANPPPISDFELQMLDDRTKQRIIWDRTVQSIREAYTMLVNTGMPAEDARGLVPTNVQTRINFVTDLRTLLGVMDVRLCTQAQFEWRVVANAIAAAIAGAYKLDRRWLEAAYMIDKHGDSEDYAEQARVESEWRGIASLFRPICYRTGKCEFMGSSDRACSIRERVQANHKIGRPSSEWHKHEWGGEKPSAAGPDIEAISPAEWMLDPEAAR